MKMPSTVYTVLTTFPTLGFGSAGDAMEYRDEALEAYEGCINDTRPVRVIQIDFDVETGAIETSRDVTEDFAAELAEQRRDAGEMPADTQCDDAYDLWRAYAAE